MILEFKEETLLLYSSIVCLNLNVWFCAFSNLEEKFKITFETDDIVDFSSFKKGIKILQKYKVKI